MIASSILTFQYFFQNNLTLWTHCWVKMKLGQNLGLLNLKPSPCSPSNFCLSLWCFSHFRATRKYCGSAIAATESSFPFGSFNLHSSLGAQLSRCFVRCATDPPHSAGVMHSSLGPEPYAGRLFVSDLVQQPRSDRQELMPGFLSHWTVHLLSSMSLMLVAYTQYSLDHPSLLQFWGLAWKEVTVTFGTPPEERSVYQMTYCSKSC